MLAGVLAAGYLMVALPPARGQTNPPAETTVDRSGTLLLSPTRDSSLGLTTGASPELWDKTDLPLTIRERLRQFEQQREAYLKEQRDLMRKLQGASDEDRERIRELIRERRLAWLEQARAFREQARERMQELRGELPRHAEVLDAAREQLQNRAQEAAERARDRRGTD
jgi:hypothetical protein